MLREFDQYLGICAFLADTRWTWGIKH